MAHDLTVTGMSCGGCEQSVEEALEGVDGVERAEADEASDSVTVEGDVDVDELVQAVEDAGYEASA